MPVRKLAAYFVLGTGALLLPNCSSDPDPVGNTAGTSSGGSPTAGTNSGGAPAAGSTSTGGGGTGSAGKAGSSTGGNTTGGGGASTAGSGGSSGGSGGAGGSAAGTGGSGGSGGSGGGSAGTGGGAGGDFKLTSPTHMDGAKFDGKFTCNGGALMTGILTELNWSGVPAGTMSFAITFIDTTIGDTNPMGQHWAIWNIPATVMKMPEGTKALMGDLMGAKQSGNFFAPCAQSETSKTMDDNYEFTIYAIPTATLNVTGSSVANALTALKALSPKPPTAVLKGHSGYKGQ